MTRDEILNMPAGREIDAFIAEMVMGVDFANHSKSILRRLDNTLPNYSTDMSAAWEVVEKMLEKGISSEVISHYPGKDYIATFWTAKEPEIENLNDFDEHIARAETAPLAICRAALLATLEGEQ